MHVHVATIRKQLIIRNFVQFDYFLSYHAVYKKKTGIKRNILHLILFEIEYLKERSASMPGDNFENLVQQYGSDVAQRTEKYNRLKELEIFVLDNSIRESTVGKYYYVFLL